MIVGLTGGIGVGKSLVCQYFEDLKIDVIYADKINTEILDKNQSVQKKIIKHFGTLDKKTIKNKIFTDNHDKQWLEGLLHPLIKNMILAQIDTINSPYGIVEIPLLIEKKWFDIVDKILLITCDPEIQLQRIMSRDNCTKSQAQDIIKAQAEFMDKKQFADDIIYNNGNLKDLGNQVLALHTQYSSLSNKNSISDTNY